jgi:CBS domain-containing protein
LNIIEERVTSGQTGAAWMIENYRELQQHVKPSVALRCLVKHDLKYQNADIPVHKWGPVISESSDCGKLQQGATWVEDIMNQEVFSVKENVSIEIAKTIMDWKNIHHLPIENQQGDLIGILAYSMINARSHSGDTLVRDLMVSKVVTIGPGDRITRAKELMDWHQISCLPVVENDKVLGILTRTDFK